MTLHAGEKIISFNISVTVNVYSLFFGSGLSTASIVGIVVGVVVGGVVIGIAVHLLWQRQKTKITKSQIKHINEEVRMETNPAAIMH